MASGRVIDASDGKGIAGAIGSLTLTDQATDGYTMPISFKTEADGSFKFGDLDAGDYVVTITPPAGVTCTPLSHAFTLMRGQQLEANFACDVTSDPPTPPDELVLSLEVYTNNGGVPGDVIPTAEEETEEAGEEAARELE